MRHYQLIRLVAGLPDVLTVMCEGAPTIALAGVSTGAPASCAGSADEFRLSSSDRGWKLTVETNDGGTITVTGEKPVWSNYRSI